MNEFNVMCEQHGIYDAFTSDYVDALSQHILRSAKGIKTSRARQSSGVSSDRPIVILEIGAGSGRLSHFLRESIADINNNARQTTKVEAGGGDGRHGGKTKQQWTRESAADAQGTYSWVGVCTRDSL
jgi:hypothetical protein